MIGDAEAEIVDRFHDLYYRRWQQGHRTIEIDWLGCRTLKCPLDLWVFQEIIFETRPDIIVETGTFSGGSALFLASVCDLVDQGRVLTVDLDPQPNVPAHPRITYLQGSSTDAERACRAEQGHGDLGLRSRLRPCAG
jgi:cephalosporin hydroxylase